MDAQLPIPALCTWRGGNGGWAGAEAWGRGDQYGLQQSLTVLTPPTMASRWVGGWMQGRRWAEMVASFTAYPQHGI